ncbi:hypothetical protein SAZ11_36540 [Streptomyces sp. FXJ1.4098]|nr:hypothetical protein [Streptomyces sp. FXJ1.4098]
MNAARRQTGGTASSPGGTSSSTVAYSRCSAIERTSATCRASTLAPGSSARFRRSQCTD